MNVDGAVGHLLGFVSYWNSSLSCLQKKMYKFLLILIVLQVLYSDKCYGEYIPPGPKYSCPKKYVLNE